MLDRTVTAFSHVKSGDTPFLPGGLRDFFFTAIGALLKPPTEK